MNLNNSSLLFAMVWAIADTIVIIGGGFRVYLNIVKKLDRIDYAIFNDGHGMKQQVAELWDNQQEIKTDIALIKADIERLVTRTRKKAS